MTNPFIDNFNILNSQLIILNIEGIQSECNIYEYQEEETIEEECPACHGEKVIEFYSNNGYSKIDDCPKCGGCGVIYKNKIVQVKEVEIESNIYI